MSKEEKIRILDITPLKDYMQNTEDVYAHYKFIANGKIYDGIASVEKRIYKANPKVFEDSVNELEYVNLPNINVAGKMMQYAYASILESETGIAKIYDEEIAELVADKSWNTDDLISFANDCKTYNAFNSLEFNFDELEEIFENATDEEYIDALQEKEVIAVYSNLQDAFVMSKEQQVLTLDEYLGLNKHAFVIGDFGLDKQKIPKGLSERQQKKLSKDFLIASNSYHMERNALTEEYNALVESGEIRVPTDFEHRLSIARGNDENEAVKASRRLLEKQGVDYKTGKKIEKETQQPTKKKLEMER